MIGIVNYEVDIRGRARAEKREQELESPPRVISRLRIGYGVGPPPTADINPPGTSGPSRKRRASARTPLPCFIDRTGPLKGEGLALFFYEC